MERFRSNHPDDREDAPDYSSYVQERIAAMSYSELRDWCSNYYWDWAWCIPSRPRPAGGFSKWLRDRIGAYVAEHRRAMAQEY